VDKSTTRFNGECNRALLDGARGGPPARRETHRWTSRGRNEFRPLCYNAGSETGETMQIFEKLKPLALLLLRLGVGAVFLSQGYLKLFGSPAKWLVWYPQHGFPSYFAYLAGSMEFFGGILLILEIGRAHV
jgi:hypothetical protein